VPGRSPRRSRPWRGGDGRVHAGVVVGHHAEHVSGLFVGRRHRRDGHVPLVLPAGPVDHMVLAVDAQVEPFDPQAWQRLLPGRQECLGLAVDEVDLVVEHRRGDLGGFADAPQRHLAHQHGEDRPVLVGLPLVGDGVAALRLDREGPQAGFAAVAAAPGRGGPELLVGPRARGRYPVVLARLVRAGGGPDGLGEEAGGLLEHAQVDLHGDDFTAGQAFGRWRLGRDGDDGVEVGAIRPLGVGRPQEVGAVGVLAVVDLDVEDRLGDPGGGPWSRRLGRLRGGWRLRGRAGHLLCITPQACRS